MNEYGVVNVSVSNHYSKASSVSDVVTQGLLGEKVQIIDSHATHIQIQQDDGYQSWIPDDQLVPELPLVGEIKTVRSHFMPIFASSSITAPRIRDAVIGCQLQVVDTQNDWYRVILPDGAVGWAQMENFAPLPRFSPPSILSVATEFLGYQYFWGGKTPKGFDCSGFVQTVFALHGVQLSRDAWQQQQNHQISTDYLDAQPGDLLFFSNKPDTVTHVAISLGQQRYIHASGWVKMDSFDESDPVFNRQRSQDFVSVNRYSDTDK